jgi:hypothetical protein
MLTYCVYVFSLHRESLDMILGDKPLLFQGGVLSHWGAAEMSWMQKWIAGKTLEAATHFIGLQREAVSQREGEGRWLSGVQCREF